MDISYWIHTTYHKNLSQQYIALKLSLYGEPWWFYTLKPEQNGQYLQKTYSIQFFWKFWYFDWDFTKVCLQVFTQQRVNIAFALNRQQATTRTYDVGIKQSSDIFYMVYSYFPFFLDFLNAD